MFTRYTFPGPFNPAFLKYAAQSQHRHQTPHKPAGNHPPQQAWNQYGAHLQHLQALSRQMVSYQYGAAHQHPVPPTYYGFTQPAHVPHAVPVGVTRFVHHLEIPRSQQNRVPGELQTLRLNWQPQGVMTRYPVQTQEVAEMLQRALQATSPRIINLMNPGDMDIHHSYVYRMPEGRTCRIGNLDVVRQTIGRAAIGSNASGGPVVHVGTLLHVRDHSQPHMPWRTVEHHAIEGWEDTTALPTATFEQMWRSLYQPGRVDQGVVHCAGGVGRTPTLMWRLAFQAHLDRANAQGRPVSPAETAQFLNNLTQEGRFMRGGQVLPDGGQIRMLYDSCLRALPYQQVMQHRFR